MTRLLAIHADTAGATSPISTTGPCVHANVCRDLEEHSAKTVSHSTVVTVVLAKPLKSLKRENIVKNLDHWSKGQ